ncbi:protein Aster-B isoform X7 [Parus major]|uniref:protein Aster-B isoform X7 n=1 Tax=Parus major TaxID=9157 RepID=UPI0014439FBB|nr:protein Aster-B isoform X7 [Parus major]
MRAREEHEVSCLRGRARREEEGEPWLCGVVYTEIGATSAWGWEQEEKGRLMPAANMTETLQLPALRVPEQQVLEGGCAWSSSSTPTLRRKRFKMRRMKNVQEQSLEAGRYQDSPSSSKEYLQLPSIEITPSSDEDTPWSNCSTPSASPRRKRFLLRKWLRVREKKECSESSSQQSSQQSSHDDDSARFLSPSREDSTASNSNRSTPACSPILRKRSRSPTPQDAPGDAMVEKGSDHSSDKSPSTPEQGVQRSCSSQSGRSGAKNSKSHKRLSKVSLLFSLLSPTVELSHHSEALPVVLSADPSQTFSCCGCENVSKSSAPCL